MDTMESDSVYKIYEKDTSNFWDQLRILLNEQRYTTQDHASLALLQEFPNVFPYFMVRTTDNLLLGALVMIELDEFIYGNIYVVRPGFRSVGVGWKLCFHMLDKMSESVQKKTMVLRAVEKMHKIYCGPPFFASRLYDMYVCEFENTSALRDFFRKPTSERNWTVPLKELNTVQKKALFEFDLFVTGVDRKRFVEEYFFNITIVDGMALFNKEGKVTGLISVVPTSDEEGLLKIAPIYASNPDDAGTLVHAMCDRITDPRAHFVFHCRTGSAGEWIMEKLKENGKPPRLASITVESTLHQNRFIERCRPELIFAPTNSPVHFDT